MKTDLGRKGQYYITIKYPFELKYRKQKVSGYKVVIEEFEEYDFFIHRGIEEINVNKWRISEKTTGFAFPSNLDRSTRQATINRVAKFLNGRGKDKLIESLGKAKALIADRG